MVAPGSLSEKLYFNTPKFRFNGNTENGLSPQRAVQISDLIPYGIPHCNHSIPMKNESWEGEMEFFFVFFRFNRNRNSTVMAK